MATFNTFPLRAYVPASGNIFLALLERIQIGHIMVATPDGRLSVFGDPNADLRARLTIHDWRACGAILRAGDIGFAQAYREGWLDSSNLLDVVVLALRNEALIARTVTGGMLASAWYRLLHWLRPNTRRGSRKNIHAHYDIGNNFYALWLDSSWTYSSAWFAGDRRCSLEQAQEAKYRRIVDTLGLKAGMRVLEIGCGWGGFAIYAGQRGIRVHGVTVSSAQLDEARSRVEAAGLSGHVTLELKDYRDIEGSYDAIVSIEMFEAVGEHYWPVYFGTLRQHLAPGGKALVQTITIDESRFESYRLSSDFIREYIFPGGMLPSPRAFMDTARRQGLFARPALVFGMDYMLTLHLWRQKFEASLAAIRELGFDEMFIRTWRLYLIYCEAGFAEGRTDVMQFLIERKD